MFDNAPLSHEGRRTSDARPVATYTPAPSPSEPSEPTLGTLWTRRACEDQADAPSYRFLPLAHGRAEDRQYAPARAAAST
jgi:hypothetical protein